MMPLFLGGHGSRLSRVLCLGAHPDDLEIGCGGTVLSILGLNRGLEVNWVVFSGADGPREREARVGASLVLGGAARSEIQVLGFRDGFFPFQGAEIKEQFENLKARVSPDLVLTHWGGDGHQDHRLISDLTWNTFRDHLVLEYEVPKYDGDMGNPNIFVPMTEELREEKIQILLKTFESQRDKRWFTRDTFQGLMRLRGVQCAAPTGYAEGFFARKVTLSPAFDSSLA